MYMDIFVYWCTFFLNVTATTENYTYGHTLSRHDALPISADRVAHGFVGLLEMPRRRLRLRQEAQRDPAGEPLGLGVVGPGGRLARRAGEAIGRSEEHTSELQSLMRISYAVFCLKKKTQ